MNHKINFSNLKGYFVLLAVLLLGLSVSAQRTITGTVTDAENGETLIGANVIVEGTSVGTSTDIDGNYTLEISADAKVLVFSYTGFAGQSVTIGASNIINVQMSSGEVLDEVVIIGYGSTKKEDATGSIQEVDQRVFNKGQLTSPQELLSGKIAGVSISTNSGAPGEGSTIRIRGGSSLNASNDPLIVIDGVPLDNSGTSGSRNNLNFINPNDIETFTVLKDASAAAIYGSRAANGVILITTKKGSLGKKISVNYNGNIAFSNRIGEVDVFSADDYRAFITETYGEGSVEVNSLGDANTNWQDEIYTGAVGHDHNFSFSGGIADVLPYRVSLGYTNKEGVLRTDKFERTTAALNLNPGFLDNTLQVNFSFKGMWTNNRFADRAAIGDAVSFDPTQPVFDPASPFEGYFTYFADSLQNPNVLAPKNPVALLDLTRDRANVTRYLINGSVDYRFKFLPELRANLNLGYDYSLGEGNKDIPGTASFAYNALTGGGVDNEFRQKKTNELLEFYLNYVKEINADHKIDIMGGYSWSRFFIEDDAFNSDVAGIDFIDKPAEPRELFLVSFFSRLNYTLMDRFIATFTMRYDGVSRFSSDNRWGAFPSAALAYKIIDDKKGKINSLKLRLGYGITGQQDIGDSHQELDYYAYLPIYTQGLQNARYQFGNTYVTTLRPEEYDANLKWEETTTYNAGLDFGLLDTRITGSVDVYLRETRDLLNRIPIPAGTNLSNFITTNVGNLENRGIELGLNFVPVRTKDMLWEFGINMTRNRNEITKLTATDDPNYQGVLTGGISGGVGTNVQIHSVGHPTFSYFVGEQVYDEDGNPIEGLFVDRNGDGVVTPDDAYRFENPAPDYFFGFTSNFDYKNFSFSFAGRSHIGNYVYNNAQSDRAFLNSIYTAPDVLRNVLTEIQNIGFVNPVYLSDHFVQNASFLRIDHITASYRFNEVFKDQGSLTVSATLQNPILITPYTGVDPEIQNGIDNNFYPRTRTFLIGLNANF
ncbi:MAG: TonB-dependent receptor [Bacteroidota bacterium]